MPRDVVNSNRKDLGTTIGKINLHLATNNANTVKSMGRIHLYSRLLLVAISVILIIITGSLTPLLSQWEVKDLHTLSGKITASDEVVVGNLAGGTTPDIVWVVSGKKGDDRLMILNGTDGEIKWKSNSYYKIFTSTVKIADVDGDGRNELLFTAIPTEDDAVTLYVVANKQGMYTQTPKPQPTTSGSSSPNSNPPPSDIKSVANMEQQPPPVPVQYLGDNVSASIPYSVKSKSVVEVEIFSGTGDIVRNLVKEETAPGDYTKTWDGRDENGKKLPVGTYFYKVTVGTTTQARKQVAFK